MSPADRDRPVRASRRSSPALAGSAVIGLVVIAAAITVIAPTVDEIQSPIENTGPLGKVVSSRQAAVEVEAVTVARAVDLGEGDQDVTTEGAWVAIDLTVTCRLRTCGFGDSLLRIGDRSYGASPLTGVPSFSSMAAEAGVGYETTALFEIPLVAQDAGRADLLIQPDRTAALDSRAVVELDLPDASADAAVVRPTVIAERG